MLLTTKFFVAPYIRSYLNEQSEQKTSAHPQPSQKQSEQKICVNQSNLCYLCSLNFNPKFHKPSFVGKSQTSLCRLFFCVLCAFLVHLVVKTPVHPRQAQVSKANKKICVNLSNSHHLCSKKNVSKANKKNPRIRGTCQLHNFLLSAWVFILQKLIFIFCNKSII